MKKIFFTISLIRLSILDFRILLCGKKILKIRKKMFRLNNILNGLFMKKKFFTIWLIRLSILNFRILLCEKKILKLRKKMFHLSSKGAFLGHSAFDTYCVTSFEDSFVDSLKRILHIK